MPSCCASHIGRVGSVPSHRLLTYSVKGDSVPVPRSLEAWPAVSQSNLNCSKSLGLAHTSDMCKPPSSLIFSFLSLAAGSSLTTVAACSGLGVLGESKVFNHFLKLEYSV